MHMRALILTPTRTVIAFTILFSQFLCADTAEAKREWQHDFSRGNFNYEYLGQYGDRKAVFLHEGGLKMRLPPREKEDWAGLDIRCRITGDFTITAKYKVNEVGTPQGGSGAGLSLEVKDEDSEWASLQHVKQKYAGEVVVSHRGRPKPEGGYDSEADSLKAPLEEGLLTLQRKGTQLEYWFSEGAEQPRLIKSFEFSNQPVDFIKFGVKEGGGRCTVDVTLKELSITADRLRFDVEPASSFPGWILVGGIVSAILVVAIAAVFFIRRRQA